MSKPTVVFDFDGVIHQYRCGWLGDAIIPDPPVPGIKGLIKDLRRDHEVVVVSTRCCSDEGKLAVVRYLRVNGIEVDRVTAEKPPAVCYIDDRAICFRGNTEGIADKVRSFKSWVEKK